MAVHKILDDVYHVGAQDWDRELFDELVPLPDGTSYNAYLIIGSEKTALIDTVDPDKKDVLISNLKKLKVEKIDYLIASHAEQDHSGSIPDILELYPEAKVVTNPKCKGLLIDLLHIAEEKFIEVKDGEILSLGNKTLEFIYTPWVHWPETMSTYLVEDKILFSCDFFGSHRATSHLFVYDEYKVLEDAKRYYAEIMMPFRNHIKRNIDKLSGKDIRYIAPSHGPIYNNPELIINAYKEWISEDVVKKVIIPYVSMHGSTESIVNYVVDLLTEKEIEVIPINLIKEDIGKLSLEIVDASTIVFGTPYVLSGAHPAVVYAAYFVNALKPKTKIMSIIGSYGWGGKGVDQIKNLLSSLKVEWIEPLMIKGHPDAKAFEQLDQFVEDLIKKMNEI